MSNKDKEEPTEEERILLLAFYGGEEGLVTWEHKEGIIPALFLAGGLQRMIAELVHENEKLKNENEYLKKKLGIARPNPPGILRLGQA